MSVSTNEAIVRRFFETIERKDYNMLVEQIYAPDAQIWHNADGLTITPADNVIALQQMDTLLKAHYFTIDRLIDFGGGAVAKFTLHATSHTNVQGSITVCGIFDIVDRRVVRFEEYYDALSLAPLVDHGQS